MVSLKANVVILLYDVQSPNMRSEDETWGRWWCHPGTQPADTHCKVVNDIREIIQRAHCSLTKLPLQKPKQGELCVSSCYEVKVDEGVLTSHGSPEHVYCTAPRRYFRSAHCSCQHAGWYWSRPDHLLRLRPLLMPAV